MAIYSEIVGATNFKRKQLTQSGEGLGRFVISVPNEIKEKLIDGEEFETVIELNDNLLRTSIKQRSNLKNWGISVEVNNGTTLLVGSVIGVINQKRVGDIEQTIMTCLMSNGSYLVVSVEYDVVNKTFNASLTSRGLGGSDLPAPTIADEGKVLAVGDGGLWALKKVDTTEFLAPTYDSTTIYNTSDLVVYNGALYVCKADNTTGTWDDTKWDTTTIAESVLGMLNVGY